MPEPLTDEEVDACFAILKGKAVVLAISGGRDSMALLHLFAEWRKRTAGPPRRAIAVTIDHGLRPQAATEAQWVAEHAKALGIDHVTARWEGEKPATGVQAAARNARYRLLFEHAQKLQDATPTAVVTAHNQEDQAETLLMRLARGSGLDGLAAMPTVSERGDCQLIRPFLEIPRARLTATLETRGHEWIDDPSNDSDDFERIRIRNAAAQLQALGLEPPRLALSARRLLRARRSAARTASEFFRSHVNTHDGLMGQVNLDRLIAAGEETALRTMTNLIELFGGDALPPRMRQTETLLEAIFTHHHGSRAGEHFADTQPQLQTLGGTKLHIRPGKDLCIWREWGRQPLPVVAISPGQTVIWDGRFEVSLASNAPDGLEIRALGPSIASKLMKSKAAEDLARLRAPAIKDALATLPALWAGTRLAAILYPGLKHALDELSAIAPKLTICKPKQYETAFSSEFLPPGKPRY